MRYTVDRIESSYYVLLKYPEEEQQLLVKTNQIAITLHEGDIVELTIEDGKYKVKKCVEERKEAEERVRQLLERLQKRNHE